MVIEIGWFEYAWVKKKNQNSITKLINCFWLFFFSAKHCIIDKIIMVPAVPKVTYIVNNTQQIKSIYATAVA